MLSKFRHERRGDHLPHRPLHHQWRIPQLGLKALYQIDLPAGILEQPLLIRPKLVLPRHGYPHGVALGVETLGCSGRCHGDLLGQFRRHLDAAHSAVRLPRWTLQDRCAQRVLSRRCAPPRESGTT